MPNVHLSSLTGPELRRLLDITRQRGQAAQAHAILKEMADRRARYGDGADAAPFVLKTSEARVINVDLGDPLDRDDEDTLTLAAEPAAYEPDLAADGESSLTLDGRPKPRRRLPLLGFAAGIALGAAAGWGVAYEYFLPPEAPAPTEFPAGPMLRADQIPPPPAPPAPAPAVVTQAAPAEVVATAAPQTDAVEVAPADAPVVELAETETPAEPAPTIVAEAKPAESKACAHVATPADRAICEDERLQRLQKELRQAYADALSAHEDRATLRQRQLAWKDARNTVSDPQRLARLYEARIRKLHASAAEARRER